MSPGRAHAVSVLVALGTACGGRGESPSTVTADLELEFCGETIALTASSALRLHLLPPAPDASTVAAVALADGPIVAIDDAEAYLAEDELMVLFAFEDPGTLEAGERYVGGLRIFHSDPRIRALVVMDLDAVRVAAARDAGPSDFGLPESIAVETQAHELHVKGFEDGFLEADITPLEQAEPPPLPSGLPPFCTPRGTVRGSIVGPSTSYEPGDECFAPDHMPELSQQGRLVYGCACDPEREESTCVRVCEEIEGEPWCHAIAMFCTDGHWSWGYDGPCRPVDAGP